MKVKVITLEKYRNISASKMESSIVDSGGESQKLSGLEAFLTRPDNSLMLKKLFSDIEVIVYNKVRVDQSTNNKDIYELARYIGKAQLLIDFSTEIVIHTKDEKAIKQINKKIYYLLNDISDIYITLEENADLNTFDYKLALFREDINDLKDLILKFLNV